MGENVKEKVWRWRLITLIMVISAVRALKGGGGRWKGLVGGVMVTWGILGA